MFKKTAEKRKLDKEVQKYNMENSMIMEFENIGLLNTDEFLRVIPSS